MPIKRLPPELVARLKKSMAHHGQRPSNWKRLFLRLKNVDHRKNSLIGERMHKHFLSVKHRQERHQDSITLKRRQELDVELFDLIREHVFTKRVRSIDVSRTHPEIGKVVIKVVHDISSTRLIEFINLEIDKVNSLRGSTDNWVLQKPNIVALNEQLVAMAYTDKVSADKIKQDGSSKGKEEFDELNRDHPKNAQDYFFALNEIERISPLRRTNLFFAGVEKGKLVFVPMADYF